MADLSDEEVGLGAAPPAGGLSDADVGFGHAPASPGALGGMAEEAWHNTTEQAKGAWGNISDSLKPPAPQDETFLHGYLRSIAETPGHAAQFAKGALQAAGLPFAPLIGAGQSLIGRPLAGLIHKTGEMIAPDTAVKESPEQVYQHIKDDVGFGLGLVAPRARAAVAPPSTPKATAPALPTAESLTSVRPETGARLIPPDAPHILPRHGSVGAAGISPLDGVSPETISKLRSVMIDQGFTPYSLEQRLEEMSSHHFLGELTPNTEAAMGAVAAPPGPGKLEIINAVTQRAKEAGERMRATFDRAFGDVDNLTQRRMILNIEQSKAAKPFYDAFRNLRIAPTPEIMDLMPRLQAAGAFGEAKALAGVKGFPWEDTFAIERAFPGIEGMPWQKSFPAAREPVGKYPTAASWDLVKQALDSKIEQSFNQFGEPTKWTHAYTELKNELVSAIDNHPDPNVAGMWRQARDVYAGPAQIKSALNMGKRVLTERVDADELPFLTASYGRSQMEALAAGIRKSLENTLGRPGKQELRVINQVLSPNNQSKIRWVIGDQAADELIRSVEHEAHMHGAPTRIYQGSPTQFRIEAQKQWSPPESGKISVGDIAGAVKHPIATGIQAAEKFGVTRRAERQESAFAKLREEASRIFTLQGPERNAVAHWLLQPETEQKVVGFHKRGGRVNQPKQFAHGGRIAARTARVKAILERHA